MSVDGMMSADEMMTIDAELDLAMSAVRVLWRRAPNSADPNSADPDSSDPSELTGVFPFIWLRDNDPSAFHPETRERVFDLATTALDVEATSVAVEGASLIVRWGDHAAPSTFELSWLREHIPGQPRPDPARVDAVPWSATRGLGESPLPQISAETLRTSDQALLEWLIGLQRSGVSLVDGLEDHREAGLSIGARVGFARQTNFGTTFEVKSKPTPNNLAYTALALPLHTDLPNQELPPGFQLLHCLENEAEGGESVLCDGYAVAESLRAQDPEAFELLSTVSIPFRFHDADTDLRARKRVINLDERGAVREICFNAHIADSLDIAPELMLPYYRAYQRFMITARSPEFVRTFKLRAGQMLVFDNRRILHGRSAFDHRGGRHLLGFYIDRGELESRLRVLSRTLLT